MNEYTKELEKLVVFLAGAYNACYQEYHRKHLDTTDYRNPSCRELTEQEKSEMMRFPLITGQLHIFLRQLCETEPKVTSVNMKLLREKLLKK